MTDEIKTAIDAVSSQTWSVWFLIGAALVFWMQAGCNGRDRIYQSEECR